jgi:hypothetical protein
MPAVIPALEVILQPRAERNRKVLVLVEFRLATVSTILRDWRPQRRGGKVFGRLRTREKLFDAPQRERNMAVYPGWMAEPPVIPGDVRLAH